MGEVERREKKIYIYIYTYYIYILYNLYIHIPIGSMYAIYGNIYHQYTPVMLAYIPYMDPMGYIIYI